MVIKDNDAVEIDVKMRKKYQMIENSVELQN